MDSNEYAFRTATMNGFRQAYEKAGPVVLEPIMKATVTVPSEFQVSPCFSTNFVQRAQ